MFIPLKIEKVHYVPAALCAALIALLFFVHALNALYPDLRSSDFLTGAGGRLSLTLLSQSLVHGNWLHLGVNLLYLYFFGNLVCRALGNGAYVAIVLAAAAAAGLVDLAMREQSMGASALVSGLMGAAIAAYPMRKIHFLYLFGVSNGTFSMPLIWVVALAIVLDVSGLVYYSANLRDHVAYWEHLAGLIVGYGITYAALRDRMFRRRDTDEPTMADLWANPRLLALRTARTAENGRIVDTWLVFMAAMVVLVVVGIYIYFRSLQVPNWATASVVIAYPILTLILAITVYRTQRIGAYLAAAFIALTVAINVTLRWHLSDRFYTLLVLLWLLQATSETVYWPRWFAKRYGAVKAARQQAA